MYKICIKNTTNYLWPVFSKKNDFWCEEGRDTRLSWRRESQEFVLTQGQKQWLSNSEEQVSQYLCVWTWDSGDMRKTWGELCLGVKWGNVEGTWAQRRDALGTPPQCVKDPASWWGKVWTWMHDKSQSGVIAVMKRKVEFRERNYLCQI